MIIILNCLLPLRFIFCCFFVLAFFENRMNVKRNRDKNGSYLQMDNPFVHSLAAKSKVEYQYDPKMTVSKMRFDCLCTLQYYFPLLFYHLSTSRSFLFFLSYFITSIVIFRVYCADHTYCTLRFPINATTEMIKASAADKLQLNRSNEDLVLAEVKSNGERTVFKDHDVSIPTALYLNARIFVSSKDHIDALVSESFYFICSV